MFLRDTLLRVLTDQRPAAVRGSEVPRRITRSIPKASERAIVLAGVRRCGKSVLQAQLMRRSRRPFYCNLEDTRLFGLSPPDFPTFMELVFEIAGDAPEIYLDEIQVVPEWQRLVRSLLDRGALVCLTGSNAALLGRELGAKLTGRHRTFEVFPYGFGEFLSARGGAPGAARLREWLDDGGFPANVQTPDAAALRELFRDIVLRDIAVRHGLRETRHLMAVALFLLANTGQPFSLQRLAKSLGVPSVAQAGRFVEYLSDAYLLLPLPKFSSSIKKRIVAPAKYYAIDNGLRRANSLQQTSDVGHRLENAVYLALRSRGVPAQYAGEAHAWECDFVTDDEAIQVCAEVTAFNRDRELRGVVQAARLPGRRRARIVTLDQRDRIVLEGVPVDIVPAWDWLTRA